MACATDLQQQLATLVGEVTGGGANPGSLAALGQVLVAFIPSGRAINPITHTNWEHVGVPAAEALQVVVLEKFWEGRQIECVRSNPQVFATWA